MSDNSNGGGWNDTTNETTSQSWFSRIGGALTGILVGLILLPVARVLLFWNEGRAVQTARSLEHVPFERAHSTRSSLLIFDHLNPFKRFRLNG